MKHVRATLAMLLVWMLAAPVCGAATTRPGQAAAAGRDPARALLDRLEAAHSRLLARHRPDLAASYGLAPQEARFVPLDQVTIAVHLRALQTLLAQAGAAPAGPRADSLRARLLREIAQTQPGGELYRDAFLWLDVLEAAALAPWRTGSARGCDRVRRGGLQLRTFPEAVRAAAVLMAGRRAPEPVAFEARLTRLETLLRQDLPRRTEACKEPRHVAAFVVADSLAAASLADFRRMLSPGE